MIFPEFIPESKVWIYASNRELTQKDQETIASELEPFISEWAAHGKGLLGKSSILENRFVVLVVDESKAMASGCSIDTSVRFMKDLGAKMGAQAEKIRLESVGEVEAKLKEVKV